MRDNVLNGGRNWNDSSHNELPIKDNRNPMRDNVLNGGRNWNDSGQNDFQAEKYSEYDLGSHDLQTEKEHLYATNNSSLDRSREDPNVEDFHANLDNGPDKKDFEAGNSSDLVIKTPNKKDYEAQQRLPDSNRILLGSDPEIIQSKDLQKYSEDLQSNENWNAHVNFITTDNDPESDFYFMRRDLMFSYMFNCKQNNLLDSTQNDFKLSNQNFSQSNETDEIYDFLIHYVFKNNLKAHSSENVETGPDVGFNDYRNSKIEMFVKSAINKNNILVNHLKSELGKMKPVDIIQETLEKNLNQIMNNNLLSILSFFDPEKNTPNNTKEYTESIIADIEYIIYSQDEHSSIHTYLMFENLIKICTDYLKKTGLFIKDRIDDNVEESFLNKLNEEASEILEKSLPLYNEFIAIIFKQFKIMDTVHEKMKNMIVTDIKLTQILLDMNNTSKINVIDLFTQISQFFDYKFNFSHRINLSTPYGRKSWDIPGWFPVDHSTQELGIFPILVSSPPEDSYRESQDYFFSSSEDSKLHDSNESRVNSDLNSSNLDKRDNGPLHDSEEDPHHNRLILV